MRKTLFILLTLLAGCDGGGELGLRASSENEQVRVALEDARTRLRAAFTRYQSDPTARGHLCRAVNCSDNVVCQRLRELAENSDKTAYLRQNFFSSAGLSAWQDALSKAELNATQDSGAVAFNEVNQDAYANGTRVFAYTPAFLSKSRNVIAAVLAHELQHVAGRLDTGAAGPFAEMRDAIDGAAACAVALVFGIEHPEIGPGAAYVIYREDFADGYSFLDWTNPPWNSSYLVLRNLRLQDVRLRASAPYFGSLLARVQENGELYSVVRNTNTVRLSYFASATANETVLRTENVSSAQNGELVFELSGNHLKVLVGATTIMELDDTHLGASGTVGVFGAPSIFTVEQP